MSSASAISLGTIFASIRLNLDQLTVDASSANDIFTSVRDELVSTFSDMKAPALGDELEAVAQQTQEAFANIADAATSGMADMDAAVEDGMASATDAVTAGGSEMTDAADASSSETGGFFSDLAAKLADFASQAMDAMGSASESFAALGEGAAGMSLPLGGMFGIMQGGIGHVGTLLTSMLAFQAIGGATMAVSNFAGSLIGMNSEMESLHQQLTSITGSSGVADKILIWVKQFGQQVPDTTEHLAQATVAVQALGLNAEQVMPSIASVAAAMGKDLPTAARAFVDAYEGRWMMLQNDLHVTKKQLEEFGLVLNAHGQVVGNTLVPAFEKLAKVKFGNALQNQMQTMGGQLSNLTDRIQFFAMNMGKPLFDAAKQGLGGIFDFLDSHKSQVDGFASSVGKNLASAFTAVSNAVKGIPAFLRQVESAFLSAFGSGNDGAAKMKSLQEAVKGFGAAFRAVASFIGSNFTPAMRALATGVGAVVAGIAAFVGFLQTHQAAMDAFKALLITWAANIVSGLVVAFGMWAVAAAQAAIATIAATWPIIAIIAAIAALGLGIYELVQHWGAIEKFFGNVASAVGTFFHTVVTFVTTWGKRLLELYLWPYVEAWTLLKLAWSAIVTLVQAGAHDVGDWFSWLGTQIHGKITQLLALIPALFQAGLRAAERVVQGAVQTVVGWFFWLFNHNYYFHDLVIGIEREFTWIRNLVTVIWSAITGFLTAAWNGDVALARTLWHDLTTGIQLEITDVQTIISTVWTAVSGFVMGILTTLTAWVKLQWEKLKLDALAAWLLFKSYILTPVQDAWNTVTSTIGGWAAWLRGKWNEIVSDVTGWWNNVTSSVKTGAKAAADQVTTSFITPLTNAITGIVTQALTWGENLMKMLAQGIANGAGAIKQAATNALGGLAKILGFHSPAAEGPGADADTWAPNLMRMYAGGIAAGTPEVTTAATGVAVSMRQALTAGQLSSLNVATGSGVGSGIAGNGLAALAGAPNGGVVNHNETLYLTIEMEGDTGDTSGDGDDDVETQATVFGQTAGSALLQSLIQRGYTLS